MGRLQVRVAKVEQSRAKLSAQERMVFVDYTESEEDVFLRFGIAPADRSDYVIIRWDKATDLEL